jgi:Tfp pilus assembly protein PilF
MKRMLILVGVVGSLLLWFTPCSFSSENTPSQKKEFCEKMIRFGQQEYWRGRYLNAKQYFKKAIQADPTNEKAWRYYDLASIFALAEKVEKNQSLIAPDVSIRKELGNLTQEEGNEKKVEKPKISPQPKQEEEFVIEDDEGC